MENNKDFNSQLNEGDDKMNVAANRYCPISESIIESCKEIKLMHEGKKKKNSLQDLWNNVDAWIKENDKETDE